MNQQLCLSIAAPGRCGYCGGQLVLQPEGDSACDHCRPVLANITTDEQWIAFHRTARRNREDRP